MCLFHCNFFIACLFLFSNFRVWIIFMLGLPISELRGTVAKIFTQPMLLLLLSPICVQHLVKIDSVVSEFGAFLCWVTPSVSPEAPLQNLYPAYVTFAILNPICVHNLVKIGPVFLSLDNFYVGSPHQ